MEQDPNIVYVGKANFRGQEQVFGMKSNNDDRFQHMYVIGQTGTGKSTLLKNLAKQDIAAGRGLALIDPHGEFAEELIESIPPHRVNDVVYFNPVDTDFPIGFNVLEIQDQSYRHLAASGLMSIFTKIWAGVWSARMEYILNNCVLALLETPGSTLLGIPRLLVDKPYRKQIIDNVKDPVVKMFWVNEFEQYNDRLRTDAIAPIQNKVGQFLSTHLIRNMVGQEKSTMSIEDIMNGSKILIANVSKGRIGEDNSALIGAMLITKIQLTAMERIKITNINDRKPFLLYVDEFQNFATDSFASILSEARKYRLGLIVAHQYIGQLVTDTSTKVRDAIFGNVGTMICFRVGAPDAEFLEKQFAPDLTLEDMANLPNRTVYLKLMSDGQSSRPFSASTLPPFVTDYPADTKDKVIEASRRQFSKPRAEVEEAILKWSGLNDQQEPAFPTRGGGQNQDDGGGYDDRRREPRPRTSSSGLGSSENRDNRDYRVSEYRAPQQPRRYEGSNDRGANNYDNQGYAPRKQTSPYNPSPTRPTTAKTISLDDLSTQQPTNFKRSAPPRKSVDLGDLRSTLSRATQSTSPQPPIKKEEDFVDDLENR